MKLGILGYGFVGKSLYEAVNDKHNFLIWDIDETKRTPNITFEQFVIDSEAIFVSVPTPMESSGKCHTGIVESVVRDIAKILNDHQCFKYVFIRSTVPPGTCQKLQEFSSSFEIIFLPEFLTEANYLGDYLDSERVVIGTPDVSDWPLLNSILDAITENNMYRPDFIQMTWAEAEMLKYATNSFLATKVIFNNEIKDLCDSLGINFENVALGMEMDPRLGTSHWKVPGPDGKPGYAGTCVLPTNKVSTPDGEVEIQNLKSGDIVFSTNDNVSELREAEVLDVVSRDYVGELLEFELETGNFICTPDHLIVINRDGKNILIPAREINIENDEIFIVA